MTSVREYYDDSVPKRLRDFVLGNRRIELAWDAIRLGAKAPRTVLEIGCGIGSISWRIKRVWPDAAVTGVDFSSVSIDVANRLFGDDGIRYEAGRLEELDLTGPFGLVVMMDVYEHVPLEERELLHEQLDRVLEPGSVLFLSFPTPEYQAQLRNNEPHRLQPVDNDVTLGDLERLAGGIHGTVTSYRKLSVWRRCDYAHCWIRRVDGAGVLERAQPPQGLGRRIVRKSMSVIPSRISPRLRGRGRRLAMVRDRLGSDWASAVESS